MTLKDIAQKYPSEFNRHKDLIQHLISLAKNRPENKGKPDKELNITAEDIEQAIQHHSGEGKPMYDVSYRTWSGDQRLNQVKQLVMQINRNSTFDEVFDAESLEFIKRITEASIGSGHPVIKGKTIGWIRVDLSNPQVLIVDEIQSDVVQLLQRLTSGKEPYLIEQLQSKWPMEKIEELYKKVNAQIGHWFVDAVSTLLAFARKNNIPKVAIHTKESAGLVRNKTFFSQIYWSAAKRLGFHEETVEYAPGKTAPFYVRQASKRIRCSGRGNIYAKIIGGRA